MRIGIFTNINRCETLGKKMSAAYGALVEAENVRRAPWSPVVDRTVAAASKAIAELQSYATSHETSFSRFMRKLLRIFGIVTSYQKVLNEIAGLEQSAATLSEEQKTKLQELLKKAKESGHELESVISNIEFDFKEIEEAVETLKTRAKNVKNDDKTAGYLPLDVMVYLTRLREMEDILNKLVGAKELNEDVQKSINHLSGRHKKAKESLEEVQRNLTALAIQATQQHTLGGIKNGGNTCYLATALQAINNIGVYRECFDPERRPLQQRTGETDAILNERKEIQSRGHAILEKISSGKKVKRAEINFFRKACYNHMYDGHKRVVESTYGQIDAVETLGRLLLVMDYKQPQLNFLFHDIVDEAAGYKDPKPTTIARKPDNYRTIEDARNYEKEGMLTLNAYPYLSQKVSAKKLLDDFWAPTDLEEYFVKHYDSDGRASYRIYRKARRTMELNLVGGKWPDVIPVTVQQMSPMRATVTAPEFLHLTSNDGVKQRYRLGSILEHTGSHYIAHLHTPAGMVTADDSTVKFKVSSSIAGYGYIYVRDDTDVTPE